MNPVDLMRWSCSPELRDVSLAARAAWLLLTMCGRRVVFLDFVALAAVTPQQASAVLTELIEAGLVHVDEIVLTPSVLALPLHINPPPAAVEEPKPVSSQPEQDGYAAWLH